MSQRSYLSIGEVLGLLRQEFPDVTISKIRFLESQGLVAPERTPSGYRKFYEHDVDRLRWVLRQQREHFLPLKVIKGRLAGASGAGVQEPEGAGAQQMALETVATRAVVGEEPRTPDAGYVGAAGGRAPTAALAQRGASPRDSLAGQRLPGFEADPGSHELAHGEGAVGSRGGVPASSQASARSGLSAVPPVSTAGGSDPALFGAAPPDTSSDAALSGGALLDAGSDLPASEVAGVRGIVPAGRGNGVVSPQTSGGASNAEGMPAKGAPRLGMVAGGLDVGGASGVLQSATGLGPSGASMTLEELSAASGLSVAEIAELERFGLVAQRTVAGIACYDEVALVVARLAAMFARYGIEARHLRLYKHSAEREAGFVGQVVLPLLKQRNPEARQRAAASVEELTRLGQALRSAFLQAALRDQLGG